MNVPDMDDFMLDQELYARKFIQTLPIRRHPKHQQFELDQLQLNHQIYENQRIAENRNDELMKKHLAKYQIIFRDLQLSDVEQTAEEKATTKNARTSTKDQQSKAYQKTLNQIKSRLNLLAHCQKQNIQNKDLSPIERKIYSRFQQLQIYSSNPVSIVEHLTEVGLSESKFRLLRQRLHIYLLKNDSDYMQTNRLFVIVLKSIYSQFQEGEIISSQEIKQRLKQSLQLDRSFNIIKKLDQDKRQSRALKITRLFYKVERTTTKINKKTTTLFRIGRLSFDYLFNNITKTKAADNPKKIYEKIEREILVNEIGFDATHIKIPVSK